MTQSKLILITNHDKHHCSKLLNHRIHQNISFKLFIRFVPHGWNSVLYLVPPRLPAGGDGEEIRLTFAKSRLMGLCHKEYWYHLGKGKMRKLSTKIFKYKVSKTGFWFLNTYFAKVEVAGTVSQWNLPSEIVFSIVSKYSINPPMLCLVWPILRHYVALLICVLW